MRLLFLSRWCPYPPDNGSKLRALNLLRQLSRCHEVSLVAFHGPGDAPEARVLPPLSRLCQSVTLVPFRDFEPWSPGALAGLFSSQPRFLVDTFSPEMKYEASRELELHDCKLLIVSGLSMMPYALELPGIPVLLEDLELGVFLDASRCRGSMARRARATLTWLKLEAFLRRALPRFAACTVTSDGEKRVLQGAVPGYTPIAVMPNGVDLAAYMGDFGPAVPDTLVYAGALTYSANYDAVRFFLDHIYPRIHRAIPDIRFRVTGGTHGVDLASLPISPGVEYTGYLGDIRPAVARSWASVVPLRVGGGTRLKLLESMALGTPAVSTVKGAEGLDVTHGKNILIAAEPALFAEYVVDLLRAEPLRARLAEAGRKLVASSYGWDRIGEGLNELVERLGVAGTATNVAGSGR